MSRTLLAVMVLAAAGAYLQMRDREITLVVDGRPVAVATMSGNVGELLEHHGIQADANQVVPSPATQLADGMTVTVDLESAAATDPTGVGVWVVEGTVGTVFHRTAELAGSPALGGAPLGRSPIRAVSVVVRGKDHDVLTNATKVGELLSAMGVKPDGDDRVLPPPSTPLRSTGSVEFTDIRFVTRQIRSRIPFATSSSSTFDLSVGKTRIVRQGRRGTAVRTFRIRIVNGRRVAHRFVGRRVAREPVTERLLVGASGGVAGSQSGQATWYDPPWSGLTAAHRSLPIGTMVAVTNLDNGRSVSVRIDDRGPWAQGRIIDLSAEAFSQIASLSQGVANVSITW